MHKDINKCINVIVNIATSKVFLTTLNQNKIKQQNINIIKEVSPTWAKLSDL